MQKNIPQGGLTDATQSEVHESVDSIQIHLRVSSIDAGLFRTLAKQRDQSLSAAFRFLLRYYLASSARPKSPYEGRSNRTSVEDNGESSTRMSCRRVSVVLADAQK
jgi:hypothetical protein